MLTVAATWTAVVLGLGVLLMMAVGPVLSAELDGRLAERRRQRSRQRSHGRNRGRAGAGAAMGEWRIRPVLPGKSAIHPGPGHAA